MGNPTLAGSSAIAIEGVPNQQLDPQAPTIQRWLVRTNRWLRRGTWKNPPVRSSDINGIRGYALVQMAERLGY